MKLLRDILLPFVPVYKAITWVRNYAYDHNILSSKSYDIPVICVGNLSVGGTGKTPTIEYLIKLLKGYKVATLSRGYKRSTKGFQLADNTSSASSIGDEPFQFYTKFKDIIVAVDANRQNGISQLLSSNNVPQVILLDDAFQHRKVKAGFNILLTAYNKLYVDDISLPTGDLREPTSGAKRADVIIVTKCPDDLKESDKSEIILKLGATKFQSVFFSTIKYSDEIFSISSKKSLQALKKDKFTLVTGIANAKPLADYLKQLGLTFEHLDFSDHHNFSEVEIEKLKEKAFVLTTEKDFTRLRNSLDPEKLFYLPIDIAIDNEEAFNNLVRGFVESF